MQYEFVESLFQVRRLRPYLDFSEGSIRCKVCLRQAEVFQRHKRIRQTNDTQVFQANGCYFKIQHN